MVMKERILEFLRRENKSSVHFAEEIGVQPSGISHILSGRNKPSLDFVIKMLEKYPFLSTEWLLFGKGTMYRGSKIPTLFDNIENDFPADFPLKGEKSETRSGTELEKPLDFEDNSPVRPVNELNGIKKIVWFYADNSFEEFSPRKG
jgi:transcriptional regulator with XRE-family HTH domain